MYDNDTFYDDSSWYENFNRAQADFEACVPDSDDDDVILTDEELADLDPDQNDPDFEDMGQFEPDWDSENENW